MAGAVCSLSLSLSLTLLYSFHCCMLCCLPRPSRGKRRVAGLLAGWYGPDGARMDVRQLRTLFYSLFKESSLVGGGLGVLGRTVGSGIAAATLSLSRMLVRSFARLPCLLFGMVATVLISFPLILSLPAR